MHHQSTHPGRRTGWVTSEYYYWHDTLNWCGFYPPTLHLQPGVHFENPETKRRFENLVRATGMVQHLVPIDPVTVSDESLHLVHPPQYLEHLQQVCQRGGGETGALTPAGPISYDIARLAAGGVTTAMDSVMTGEVDNAYVLCRPPGHHALPDNAMGFCMLANAAIGIRHVMATHQVQRVAVVDWDVHHGNGTEAIFIDDPKVLTISLHQDNLFPHDSGAATVTGTGDATGANINIPLPPGSGSGAYRHAFERIVEPTLRQFDPQLIVVASGYDASALDPLGVQMLSSEDFRWMMQRVISVADDHCNGRVVATHEGGYSEIYVPYCGLAVLEAMCGISDPLEDPFHLDIKNYGGQALSGDQSHAIEQVIRDTTL